MIGAQRKMEGPVGKWRGQTAHFEVERLQQGLVRLLKWMGHIVICVVEFRGR